MAAPRLRDALLLAGYLAGYVALDWVSYLHPVEPFAITPWNPPPGLSLALLLARGAGWWPALVAAGLAGEAVVRRGTPLPWVVVSSLAVAAAYAGAAALLRGPLKVDAGLSRLRDVAWLVAAVAAAALAAGLAYVGGYAVGGLLPAESFGPSLLRFWIGDVNGILTTAPPLLILAARLGRAGREPWRPAADLVAQAVAVAAALWVVFGIGAERESKFFYVLFLPLVWIAMRHGLAGAAAALLGIQVGIVAATEFFRHAESTVVELQLLMSSLAVTGLFLGAAAGERRRTAGALQRREAELASLFDTAPDGILTADASGAVSRANAAAGLLFGATPAALVGSPLAALLPDAPSPPSPAPGLECVARRADGATFPAEVSLGRARAGGREFYVAIVRDLTRRRAIEDQLRERQAELDRTLRLAGAAEMASAMAHELSQPLSAVGSYVRACTIMLERPGEDRARLSGTLEAVSREVARAGEVVRRLRDFFRSGTTRLERLDVAGLVRQVLGQLAKRLERHRIQARADLAPDLPEVLADRVQIETVLHNLIANAIDAIVAAGAERREIEVRARTGEAGFVVVTVRDSGPGLGPEVADQVPRPFTTTKPHGMGLGLAISRSMVEGHGGRLWLEPGGPGATFSFTLPVAPDREEAP